MILTCTGKRQFRSRTTAAIRSGKSFATIPYNLTSCIVSDCNFGLWTPPFLGTVDVCYKFPGPRGTYFGSSISSCRWAYPTLNLQQNIPVELIMRDDGDDDSTLRRTESFREVKTETSPLVVSDRRFATDSLWRLQSVSSESKSYLNFE